MWDKGLSTISIVTSSIPAFWLGILFISFFAVKLGVLPSSGTGDIGGEGGFWDKLRYLIMPATVMILTHVGIYARFLQESIKVESTQLLCNGSTCQWCSGARNPKRDFTQCIYSLFELYRHDNSFICSAGPLSWNRSFHGRDLDN